MNPFETLEYVREMYKRYVFTFQRIENPIIRDWVLDRIEQSNLLWKEPFLQLNKRFEVGKSLKDYINNDILHPEILRIFREDKKDTNSEPITPRYHQSQAIEYVIKEGKNIVVTTGTSSGKSFCFGIPIINECLKTKDVPGIKAIIIYPMNALANSQYDEFAERLHGSGLRIGLYTSTTFFKEEEVEKKWIARKDQIEPWDCEVLSREEMQKNPPDILMTNYSMLELLLTRFEDKGLFPKEHDGRLKFLVLDEVHTHSGLRGADVACLIRRLKKSTGTLGKLCCIATSATVQPTEGENAEEVISNFASRLFGEEFDPQYVIGEELINVSITPTEDLPSVINLKDEDLQSFNGSLPEAINILEKWIGRGFPNITSEIELGEELKKYPSTAFIFDNLGKNGAIIGLSKLCINYKKSIRSKYNGNFKELELELKATLLIGTVAKEKFLGKIQPLLVLKNHNFLSQGRTIKGCLTQNGPHLNDKGKIECDECKKYNNNNIQAFPLSFCNVCGQEYYCATLLEDNSLQSRELNQDPKEGDAVYILKREIADNSMQYPESWKDRKKNKRSQKPKPQPPYSALYCPLCNKLYLEKSESCSHNNNLIKVTVVHYKFMYCPNCHVIYTERKKEFNKLFNFGSIGRSTGTNIITNALINKVPPEEQKIIVFSDNRQDTALQASHMNNFFKRIRYRRVLYWTLKNNNFIITDLKQEGNSVKLSKIGKLMYKTLKKNNILPHFEKEESDFLIDDSEDEQRGIYEKYLNYYLMTELFDYRLKMQQNHEENLLTC